jgi:cell division protein FtsL
VTPPAATAAARTAAPRRTSGPAKPATRRAAAAKPASRRVSGAANPAARRTSGAAKSAARTSGAAKPAARRVAGAAKPAAGRRSASARPLAKRPAARRISGPSGGFGGPRLAGAAAGGATLPLGARVVHGVMALPDRPLVERMVRGRWWIGVVGFLLFGLVAMQVTLLNMNASIGSAVERSAALERQNGELRAEVSKLSSGERIQAAAARYGMVMPSAGQVQYRDANERADAQAALAALQAGSFAPGAATESLPALEQQTSSTPDVATTGVTAEATGAATGAVQAPAAVSGQ